MICCNTGISVRIDEKKGTRKSFWFAGEKGLFRREAAKPRSPYTLLFRVEVLLFTTVRANYWIFRCFNFLFNTVAMYFI